MNVVFGVDPGVTGAISVLVDGRLEDVVDMPVAEAGTSKRKRVQAAMLADQLCDWLQKYPLGAYRQVAVLEAVHAMPKNGAIAGFSLGHSLGTVEAVFLALGVPVESVPPQRWKKAMGVTSDKASSRARASQLYPSQSGAWKRVRDDGRAEAVLIAHWWANRGANRASER